MLLAASAVVAAQTAPATVPATLPAQPATLPAATSATNATSPATATGAAAPAAGGYFIISQDEAKAAIGSLEKGSPYLLHAELTGKGAAVLTLKLKDFFVTVDDKKLYKKSQSEAQFQDALKGQNRPQKGHYSLLNAVTVGEETHLPMETKSIRLWLGEDFVGKWSLDKVDWKLEPSVTTADGIESVSFSCEVRVRGAAMVQYLSPDEKVSPPASKAVARLVKTYSLAKDTYSLGMSLVVHNLTGVRLGAELDQAGPMGMPEEAFQRADSRQLAFGRYIPDDQNTRIQLWPYSQLGYFRRGVPRYVGDSNEAQPILWIGQINKFFGSMLYLYSDHDRVIAPEHKGLFYFMPFDDNDHGLVGSGVILRDIGVAAGKEKGFKFDLFTGPKKRELFKNEMPQGKDLYPQLNYLGTIDIAGGGSCSWCTWEWLTFGMMWLLEKFAIISLGNYGVAIILLVVLVRVLLHPLTKKSQVSMSRMSKLAPEMQKIREKYANDKETLNREMMKIYRQQGATPILGCLPMLLQMPIWIALWTALNSAVELRHAAFLPVWITDLAAPDHMISWAKAINIPLLSSMIGPVYGFNFLPILLTIAMVLQMKLTPQMGGANPQAAQQQKMMMWMMPGIMLLFFYNAPSGLTLYIMASTFAGVAEQWIIRKHIREREAAEAAAVTTVVVPGKAARGNRPKKPKGPFFTKGR